MRREFLLTQVGNPCGGMVFQQIFVKVVWINSSEFLRLLRINGWGTAVVIHSFAYNCITVSSPCSTSHTPFLLCGNRFSKTMLPGGMSNFPLPGDDKSLRERFAWGAGVKMSRFNFFEAQMHFPSLHWGGNYFVYCFISTSYYAVPCGNQYSTTRSGV